MTVRTALSTDAAKVRSIDPGDTIVVMETGVYNGHQRGRIGDSEWVSLVTAKGKVLASSGDKHDIKHDKKHDTKKHKKKHDDKEKNKKKKKKHGKEKHTDHKK